MKNFCLDLKEHATKIINYAKKEMIPLIKEEEKYIVDRKNVTYAKKIKNSNDDNNKKYHKVKDHSHYTGKYIGGAHNICNLRYKTSK